MKIGNQGMKFTAVLAAAFAVNVAWAAQPPDPTMSDANGNTAGGSSALLNLTTGTANTAFGAGALQANTSGVTNTAIGSKALSSNTGGGRNTATGFQALFSNTAGFYNTADGVNALYYNTTGNQNTAVGLNALKGDGLPTTGSNNTAVGAYALGTIGGNSSGNLALGASAGINLISGNNNVYLGNPGQRTESNVMRLGSVQTQTFIVGVNGVTLSGGGSTVIIDANGQLGTVMSSARYKDQIQDMSDQGDRLLRLRPVTFRYKADASGQQQYGLIAEEVAQVYPELVVRGAQGEVESVQYHELIPVLLDEVKRQQQEIVRQQAELQQQQDLAAARQQAIAELGARLSRMEAGAGRPDSVASR